MNTICLSVNANRILKDALRTKGFELIEVAGTDKVFDAITSHGDIYMCKIGRELIIAPGQLILIQEELRSCGIFFVPGAGDPELVYPENIRYNAAVMGRRLIHHTRHTDPVILSKARELGFELIDVKQGYTKCSLVIVNEDSAITSDMGLAAALRKHGLDILAISPGNVRLEGFPYGFLGGATGRVGDEIIFSGNLSVHPDFQSIKRFIQQKGLRAVWFEEYPLEDIGSILQI